MKAFALNCTLKPGPDPSSTDLEVTLAAGAMTYWVGEAMGSVDYRDLDETPEKTAATTRSMVTNAVHLAEALAARPYPDLDRPS